MQGDRPPTSILLTKRDRGDFGMPHAHYKILLLGHLNPLYLTHTAEHTGLPLQPQTQSVSGLQQLIQMQLGLAVGQQVLLAGELEE
jgi:hypothetical protein